MIGVIDGGTSYHGFALQDPGLRAFFTRILYLPELTGADLDDLKVLVVADRLHPGLLRRRAGALLAFAERGGTLVVLGEVEAHTWLPGARWEYRPTNFWWWLQSGADPGVRVRNPDHGLFRYLDPRDATWHYHGLFHPPRGATPLLVVEEQGCEAGAILYEDRVSSAGRLIVTSLDPFYHYGSGFIPQASRFLFALLLWLTGPLRPVEASAGD